MQKLIVPAMITVALAASSFAAAAVPAPAFAPKVSVSSGSSAGVISLARPKVSAPARVTLRSAKAHR